MTQPTPVPPTQVRHPWRAVLRTIVAGAVGAASLLPDVAGTAHLTAVPAIAQAVAVSGIITRVLAMQGVEAWMQRFVPWLSATPGKPLSS